MPTLEGKMNILGTLQNMVNGADINLKELEEFTTRNDYDGAGNADRAPFEAIYFKKCVDQIKKDIECVGQFASFFDGKGYKTLLNIVIRPEIPRLTKRLKKAEWTERTRWSNLN